MLLEHEKKRRKMRRIKCITVASSQKWNSSWKIVPKRNETNEQKKNKSNIYSNYDTFFSDETDFEQYQKYTGLDDRMLCIQHNGPVRIFFFLFFFFGYKYCCGNVRRRWKCIAIRTNKQTKQQKICDNHEQPYQIQRFISKIIPLIALFTLLLLLLVWCCCCCCFSLFLFFFCVSFIFGSHIYLVLLYFGQCSKLISHSFNQIPVCGSLGTNSPTHFVNNFRDIKTKKKSRTHTHTGKTKWKGPKRRWQKKKRKNRR